MERFLRSGPWNDQDRPVRALGLRFVYPLEQGLLNLACDGGRVGPDESGEGHEGLFLTANYNMDLSEGEALRDAEMALSLFPQRCTHFVEIAKVVLGERG